MSEWVVKDKQKEKKEIRKIIDFIMEKTEEYKRVIEYALYKHLEGSPSEIEAFKIEMEKK